MKRIFVYLFTLLICLPFRAQVGDLVVMTVNGHDVTKSEFEYFYNKNKTEESANKKTLKKYADLYLDFKLKVQAAIDCGMEATPAFIEEYKSYREMQAWDYVADTAYIEQIARASYNQSMNEIGEDGLATFSLISLTPQTDHPDSIKKCIDKILSIHDMLKDGQDFAQLAKRYSMDESATSGGAVGEFSRSMLKEEFAHMVFNLEPGEISEPFISGESMFIVKVDRRRTLGSYENNRPEIYKWIGNQPAIIQKAKILKANEYASKLGWEVRDNEAVARLDSLLEEIEPEFGQLSREYHDGLLLFDITNREVWDKASTDTIGKYEFYKSNIKRYKFDKPCFRGMVFMCSNEELFHQVEQALQGLDIKEWSSKIVEFNKEKLQLRVMRGSAESGLFVKGQNAYVDKIVFGEGDYEPVKGLPYVNVIGKVLHQPESMNDVAAQVTQDYQNWLEEQWMSKLRKQYKYKINTKVLNQIEP